jgi:hypothetical protein
MAFVNADEILLSVNKTMIDEKMLLHYAEMMMMQTVVVDERP